MHAPTLEEVMQPYLGCKKTIQQAILRVETHPSFRDLTKTGKRVLKQLVTRMSESNGSKPIKANIQNVADEAGAGYRTVQRVLVSLNEFGWIAKVTNNVTGERAKFGGFKSLEYRFSQAFCHLVKIPYSVEESTIEAEDTFIEPSTPNLADRCLLESFNLSLKEDQQEISKKNKGTKPITLPTALMDIAKFDVKLSLICKLRGYAHNRGYKLEHVWECARKAIIDLGATGFRVYRYLQNMIGKDSDYAGRAGQQARLRGEKPRKPSEISKDVKKSIENADKAMQSAVAELPKGRAQNIEAMRALLKNKKADEGILSCTNRLKEIQE
jgi:hypothetical protein